MKKPILLLVCAAFLAAPAMIFGQPADRTMPSYLTTKTPTIDGKISDGEWDAAGPPIFINQDSPNVGLGSDIDDDPYGGDADLSYSVRTMWEEPYTVYFLIEVTDDIAMEEDPVNLWERDQIELFMDGDDLTGSSDLPSFQWWESEEIFGKFGLSRYTTYEGNPGIMTDDQDSIYVDDEFAYVNVAAVANETGVNGNYIAEYAISIEPMFLIGTFDEDSLTSEAGSIVPDHTKIKAQISLSDDDNFDNGTTQRSHTLSYLNLSDWRATDEFADLLFLSEYTPGGLDGDFNNDGMLDAADIDDLTTQSAGGLNPAGYDLNGDSLVNDVDVSVWIKDLYNSWVGDANLDGEFNSGDLVTVLASGKYESGEASVWTEGDFNGNGLTDTSDLVAALSDGGYEAGVKAATSAVPEPAGIVLLLIGAVGLLGRRRS